MENSLDINELIKIEQSPKIFEEIEKIGKWIDDGLKKLELDNLIYDEEHKQELKKTRTEIKKITTELEDRRKFIKNKILEPYELFESKYNEEIKNKLTNADLTLKNGIDKIELEQRNQKEQELRDIFNDYVEFYHLENIVKFEDMKLNITLSSSMKSLKEQTMFFLKDISEDIEAISTNENKNEVMFEYLHNGFNLANAMSTISSKIQKIKELEEKLQHKNEIQKEEEIVIQNVNTLVSNPVEITEEDEIITIQFEVSDTRERLKELKQFLQEKGYKYK